jgi:hypothetical protein
MDRWLALIGLSWSGNIAAYRKTMAVTIVQSKTLVQGTPAGSHTVTFTSATTAGNAVLVIIRPEATVANGLATPISYSDNNGSTFVSLVWQDMLGDQSGVAAAVAANITGRSGHIVTISHSTASMYMAAVIYELSGVPTSSLPGAATAMNGYIGTAVVACGDLLPDCNGLAFAAMTATGTGGRTITPNWTGATEDVELDEANAVSGSLSVLRKVVTAGTVEQPKWTLSAANSWSAFGLVIRDSGTTIPAGARITQSMLAFQGGTRSTRDIRLQAPTAAGCAILLIIHAHAADDLSLATPSVTDNNSGSYTAIANLNYGAGSKMRLSAFLAGNLAGRSGHIVTVTYAKASWIAGKCYELSGVPTSSLITGTTATNTGTGTAVSSSSITPAAAGLHFAGMGFDLAGTTITPTWAGALEDAELDQSGGLINCLSILRKAAVASSAQTATWTTGSPNAWAAFNLAIKDAAVAAGGQPTMRRWGGVQTMLGGQPVGRTW